jgi:hypothetical protein
MTRPLIDPETMADAKSDFSDLASAHEAMSLEAALRNMPRAPLVAARGSCLFCEAPFQLGDGRRWCDADCRDDWERVERFKAQPTGDDE